MKAVYLRWLLASIFALQAAAPAAAQTMAISDQPAIARADTAIPDTAAGRAFSQWLAAMESGDEAQVRAFLSAYASSVTVASQMRLIDLSGGFEVVRVIASKPLEVEVLIRDKHSGMAWLRQLAVTADDPPRLDKLWIRSAPAQWAPRPSAPDAASSAAFDAQLAADLSRIGDRHAAKDRFAGTVLLMHNGQVVLHQAWGLANRESGTANGPDSGFRIGSMNKMFTAVATLQLVAAGKLSLDDTVGQVLPDYPNRAIAKTVTVRHLLTHSGGTGDIFGEQFDANRLSLKEHSDYVALFGKRLPGHALGEFHYSNYGFVLLGAVIEKVTGGPYDDYVRKHIFEPAGMTATGALPETQVRSRLTTGYTFAAGKWADASDTLPYRGTSAGGGYSTAGDLVRFAVALQSGRLLPQHLLQAATRGHVIPQYGQGFMLGGEGFNEWYGHYGGSRGMNGLLRIYPESGYVAVALSNLDPPAADALIVLLDQRLPLVLRPTAAIALKP